MLFFAFLQLQIAKGQVTLYDDGKVVGSIGEGKDLYRQDATYLNGETMSYTDNGDGTVKDNNTGLLWQQVPTSNDCTWEEAVTFCDHLEEP